MELTKEQTQIILSSVKTTRKNLEEYHLNTKFDWVEEKMLEIDKIVQILEADGK